MDTASSSRSAGRCRIGISGWTYEPWRGVFYPEGLPRKKELAFASRQMNSIEVNGTFYSLQKASDFRRWFDETPDDFLFSLKGGRFITHIKRLRDVRVPLANFLASGPLALRHKLGPLLWQLPPGLRYDRHLLEAFLDLLPRTTGEAARLAKRHDSRLPARAVLRTDADRPLRHALEVRHPSFENNPEFLESLRGHGIALVVADTAGKWPFMEDVTADFMYLRLHGDEKIYESGYTAGALDAWETKIRAWARDDRDVFVYFDNDIKVHAPFDAISLGRRLGLPPPEDGTLRSAPSSMQTA